MLSVRHALPLMLVLMQAAATVAGPAFTLCVSPKGHVCIDAIWTDCTCCQDDESSTEDDRACCRGDDESALPGPPCSCHCAHAVSPSPPWTTHQAPPTDSDPTTWHGQPCRCKHIPLVVAPDGQQPAVERTPVDHRHSFDQVIPAPVTSVFGGFSTARDAVALLPQPPPSGHLLAISCTVLRC